MKPTDPKTIKRFQTADLKYNPYKFVKYAFPWGQEGLMLEKFKGPRNWQRTELEYLAHHMVKNAELEREGKAPVMYKLAVASGRGIGKSALVSWLTLWVMSCWMGSSVTVTANTEEQIQDYTWGEIGKWHALLSLNSHWFEKTSKTIKPKDWLAKALVKTAGIDPTLYRARAKVWNIDRKEATTGMHNTVGEVIIMDEASGIPDSIWNLMHGVFTENSLLRLWIAFGNPRRARGPFYEVFHTPGTEWRTVNIDGRTVDGVNKEPYKEIELRYGEDSDEMRVEVKGQFPKVGDTQLISRGLVEDSMASSVNGIGSSSLYPKIIGVDVARLGGDITVVQRRQGYWAEHPIQIPACNFIDQAALVSKEIRKYDPSMVCVDAGGGYGLIDALRNLGHVIIAVNFGGTASMAGKFRDKRMEMYESIRDWLFKGGMLPQHRRLAMDLTAVRFAFEEQKKERKYLESKDKMAKWYRYSTDFGDALALTFSYPVDFEPSQLYSGQVQVKNKYDPFAVRGEKTREHKRNAYLSKGGIDVRSL